MTSQGAIRRVGPLPIDTAEIIQIASHVNWSLLVPNSWPSYLKETQSSDDTNRLRLCGDRLLSDDRILQRAEQGLASLAGAEGGWCGG